MKSGPGIYGQVDELSEDKCVLSAVWGEPATPPATHKHCRGKDERKAGGEHKTLRKTLQNQILTIWFLYLLKISLLKNEWDNAHWWFWHHGLQWKNRTVVGGVVYSENSEKKIHSGYLIINFWVHRLYCRQHGFAVNSEAWLISKLMFSCVWQTQTVIFVPFTLVLH